MISTLSTLSTLSRIEQGRLDDRNDERPHRCDLCGEFEDTGCDCTHIRCSCRPLTIVKVEASAKRKCPECGRFAEWIVNSYLW